MIMRKYYGFKLMSGIRTTYGEPNPRTGKFSIAGQAHVFSTLVERDEWQDGHTQLAVTIPTLRHLCRGMSVTDFKELLDFKANARAH
jgi:hypothetical protein